MEFKLIELSILTVINSLGFSFIIIALANSFKDKLYQWFSIMVIFLLGWVGFSYIGYFENSVYFSIILYRLNWVCVSFFLFSTYVFYVESFLKFDNKIIKWSIFLTSLVFAFLTFFTDTIILNVVTRDWGNEIEFGILNSYFNLFAVIVTFIFIYFSVSRYFLLPKKEKVKVVYFLIGTFFLIFFNLVFNILVPLFINSARYQHFGDYSAVIFLVLTAFAILKHKFLNIKIVLSALLISIIGNVLLIDLFLLSSDLSEKFLKVTIFVLYVFISIILVRSILNETNQKEKLASLNQQLNKLAQEQKDIIDVMGHEIRTPLSVVNSELSLHEVKTLPNIEKWLRREVSDDEIKLVFESLSSINKATKQSISIVNDMLEVARLDKNKFELNYNKFDLVQAVKTSFEQMKKVTDEEIHNLNFEASIDNLEVEADETRIVQAVQALINNSVKYGVNPETKVANISVKVYLEGTSAFISVKDEGEGIKTEDIQKLGDKFVRLQPYSQNLVRPKGTGLGLFVVKNIMRYHKGELIIQSEGEGKGSTFTLKFPIIKK